MFKHFSTDNFSEVKVLVVGDVMIDRYLWGEVRRISPEAPVPVVHLKNITDKPGGAANVAANIAGLGAKPYLIGVVGDDEEGRLFPKILAGAGIDADFIVTAGRRQTTVKTRVLAHQQQIVRIDRETAENLEAEDEEKIRRSIAGVINEIDVIIISDYGKGVLSGKILSRLITTANELQKIIMVDPKGSDFSKYGGATILTPNQKEAAEICGFDLHDDETVCRAGEKLLAELDLGALLITRGGEGMTLFEKNKSPFHLKASARKVYDVTGAGDTVIAVAAAVAGAGGSWQAAVEIANIAAGLVIEDAGTATITLDKLMPFIKKYQ